MSARAASGRTSRPPSHAAPTPLSSLRRIVEALFALLCLWAAWYHTPPGALLRKVAAQVLGLRGAARPLLSYYSAGVYGPSQSFSAAMRALPATLPPPAVSPAEALGWGAFVALSQLPAAERAQPLLLARRAGFSAALQDPRRGPAQLTVLLGQLSRELGSDDLAALALFCGEDAARYARLAAGPGKDLAQLARQLPPDGCTHVDTAGEALALGTAAALSWPLPETVRITSPFGMRDHPLLPGRLLHRGVDLGVPEGTPVHATAAGLVRRVSSDAVNGNLVVVDHGHGVTTSYLHNDVLLCAQGDRVGRSAVIARSGNTGRSTGPHLHYQLELSGVPVDPLRLRAGRAPPLFAAPGAPRLP
jgi:murein DD-endopeptidase MepM/ murein hydrolase activator NlpD